MNGVIPSSALDDRQYLSYPLQTLLNFMTKPNARTAKSTTRKRPEIDPMLQGIPGANDFRRKIEFVRDVVREWISHGGLGKSDVSPQGRLRWLGYRETKNVTTPYKHVWVQIGGHDAYDGRCCAWFDPESPSDINPDVDN